MLVHAKHCETVNAYAEIYDDCCIQDTQGILDRCAEILLADKLKKLAQSRSEGKDTA